ncbi:LuxR family transcriptional regulator [Clostridiales bacterium PH28_bin88]|nr:LuxR family transcriptional regulator [Clostridiales bacterium PH28_bin88]
MLLGSEPDMMVTGDGANGHEAYQLCRQGNVDVLLMDVKMPEVDGVEATRRICRDFPSVRVIILTTFDDDEYIFEALKHGASGYLLKDAPPAKIAEAIREIHRGGALIQPGIAVRVVQRLRHMEEVETPHLEQVTCLTEREKQIMRLVGEGKSNREIARELYITEGTVKNHLGNLLAKLGLRDRTQLAIFALRNHLV